MLLRTSQVAVVVGLLATTALAQTQWRNTWRIPVQDQKIWTKETEETLSKMCAAAHSWSLRSFLPPKDQLGLQLRARLPREYCGGSTLRWPPPETAAARLYPPKPPVEFCRVANSSDEASLPATVKRFCYKTAAAGWWPKPAVVETWAERKKALEQERAEQERQEALEKQREEQAWLEQERAREVQEAQRRRERIASLPPIKHPLETALVLHGLAALFATGHVWRQSTRGTWDSTKTRLVFQKIFWMRYWLASIPLIGIGAWLVGRFLNPPEPVSWLWLAGGGIGLVLAAIGQWSSGLFGTVLTSPLIDTEEHDRVGPTGKKPQRVEPAKPPASSSNSDDPGVSDDW